MANSTTSIIPKIAFVVARGANGVIGADGDLPWRLSSDLQRFRAITTGKPIIMGRKTWESLPRRPLPGRLNIVITRQAGYLTEGAIVVSEPGEAMKAAFEQARSDGVDEVCVIGGAQIYAVMMNLAERLYLTEVEASPDGDARLPEIIESEWHEVAREAHPAGERDDHAFVLRTLDRA
ncbi:dihydrofolate reductase [Maricaulis sp. W15]|uniref:dihydrofolate reductase n=1 Tax=Maricaulis sp. W15 TaxID=1772333 RepID=UPI00094893C5|nr:dihydrofolate reductase [Maricaulis sp. W15]OLF73974.1 dihydrofolate reductase [Maricaulis sp. W15]